MRHRLTAIACATAVLAGACSSGSDPSSDPPSTAGGDDPPGSDGDPGTTPKGRWLGRGLTPFDSCDELSTWLADEGSSRVGAYGIDGGLGGSWRGGAIDDMVMAPTASEEMAFDADSGGDGGLEAGQDYSTTNVAEEGIDEPDLVKTDGERLVVVIDGVLRVVDVSGASPELVGSLSLSDGWGHELLLAGDRAFVFSTGSVGDIPVLREAMEDEAIESFVPYADSTVIQEIDLSTPTRPEVAATQVIEGRYLTARVVDGVARVVVTTPPIGLDMVTPTGPGSEDYALETNKAIIADLDSSDWLPQVATVDGQQRVETEPLVGCEDVAHPEEFSGFGTLTVLSLDLDEALDTSDSVSVVADGETVYASAGNIYVTTNAWYDDPDEIGDDYTTTIHRFSIDEAGPVSYAGSGSVPGTLLNQFSLSEHEGVLRVATTAGSPWSGDSSESMVTTLGLESQELVELGQVGDMGAGEQIYAVRFMGDMGYVVTFRQTDPLYVLDLSDPATPQVTGELKIPGYSAYLHPVGEGLLLGVGQDGTDDGALTGAAVSLFDISDPASPTRIDQLNFGNGSSPVEWDHRAFLWWAPEGLALVPMQTWEEGSELSGAVGIDVSAGGLSERGRLTPPPLACGDPVPPDAIPLDEPASPPEIDILDEDLVDEDLVDEEFFDEEFAGEEIVEPCYQPDPGVVRAVVVGDTVLTVGYTGLDTYALADLAPGASVAWAG